MGNNNGIEPIERTAGGDTNYQTLLLQNTKIAIYGSQTQRRKFASQLIIDPVRRGMPVR